MERGSRVWQTATHYCMGKPFATLGYLIGVAIFFLFVVPNGGDAVSLWDNSNVSGHAARPVIFEIANHIKEMN